MLDSRMFVGNDEIKLNFGLHRRDLLWLASAITGAYCESKSCFTDGGGIQKHHTLLYIKGLIAATGSDVISLSSGEPEESYGGHDGGI